MAVQQLNIGVWLRDLDEVYRTDTIGAGTIALLKIMTLQLAQAHELVASLSDDAYLQRNIKGWREDYQAAQVRLGYFIARMKAIVDEEKDPATRALVIWNDVAAPILRGEYNAKTMHELATRSATQGIKPRKLVPGDAWSEGGKGFGEAFGAATLWNQAAAATDDVAAKAPGWAANAVVAWLTETAHQLEESAPGEDPTLRDATVASLKKLAEAPGAILRAVGISPTVVVVVAVAVVALIIALRR